MEENPPKKLAKRFQRTQEDFVCEHCGTAVKGTGYTNHCPQCLWSKHVDVNPGDRANVCGGMMKPVQIESSEGKFIIIHECGVCFMRKRNKVSLVDNFDAVIDTQKKFAAKH